MRLIRRLCIQLLVASSWVAAVAAWTDARQGEPIVDFFPSRRIGADAVTYTPIQDRLGRLLVGSDSLLVFDGAAWKSYPVPNSHNLAALCMDEKSGRLWAGSSNQLGYFTETSSGDFVFTSLLDRLPEEQRNLQQCWSVSLIEGQIGFIFASRVLLWDGAQFRTWDFPTNARRLFPVKCGNELWFTHVETGLYRLTKDGPHLEFPADQLRYPPAFGLERTAHGWLHISRSGIIDLVDHQRKVSSPEVDQFLDKMPISSFCQLPNGNFAIGTLGGLLIVSSEGRLLRTLTQAQGLPSDQNFGLFSDRENQLWIASAAGVARLDANGAVSAFRNWQSADHVKITSLSEVGHNLFAATDSGVFRLETATSPINSKFELLPDTPAFTTRVLGYDSGLLLSSFDGLDLYRDQHAIPLLRGEVLTSMIQKSGQSEDYFYINGKSEVMRISPRRNGQWKNILLGKASYGPNQFYLDVLDNVWVNSGTTGIWHFNTSKGILTNIHNGANPGHITEISRVTGYGEKVYFFVTQQGFVADASNQAFHRISQLPPVSVLIAHPAPDGRLLYIVFERKQGAGPSKIGLGRLSLSLSGEPQTWAELYAPKLEAAGTPTSLIVTQEDGSDCIWVGGSESVVRIKPNELPEVSSPSSPWLRIYNTNPSSIQNDSTTYTFRRHHIVLTAGSPQIDQRKDLLFQTRLGDENTPWSPPSPTSTFEFSNLSDGNYRFEVRVVNAAGLVSPAVAQTFRILPPWYRTPWAFTGYAAMLGLSFFITLRVRERYIRKHNQELETLVAQRTDELTRANAAKDEFLAGISHEIRNPMNGVIGLASAIDSTHFDDSARERFTQLRHCATHLSSLLEDILDFSRIKAGAVELDPQPFDLPELTESILAITSAESARANIPVEVAVSPAVPRRLIGDAPRIRQILLNYVINALKYSGRGTVCVTVWCQQSEPTHADLTFAVSDDGPGISPEEQARLFTRFERGAAAQRGRVSGTGLGLALCKTLAEKMGGRLWLESEPGHGSTFYFGVRLPVAGAAPAQAAKTPLAPKQPLNLRALVVDDEDYNRIALSALLEQAGFNVVTAGDGDAAIAAASETIFDAVFLDVSMPGKSGFEVARALRALPHLNPIMPIIATTAFTTADKRAQCLDAGMNSFLTKPISIEKIRAALAAASAPQRATAPVHLPGETIDPLAALRLLAARKGTALAAELKTYLAELDSEARILTEAMRQRDARAAATAAHRLIGRLAFVQGNVEADLAREIEAACVNEFWEHADSAGARMQSLLPVLFERLKKLT